LSTKHASTSDTSTSATANRGSKPSTTATANRGSTSSTSASTTTATCYAFASIGQLQAGETPMTYLQALNSVDRRKWRYALDLEYQALLDAHTWELVSADDAENIVSGKWVFKIKKNADGSVDRYKARWVARGFSQREGVDYNEIFAPVVRASSIRALAAYANALNLDMYGADVSNAFARADVDEEIFVAQPTGYTQHGPNGERLVTRLLKGLYGTKQAARLWNKKLISVLLKDGWTPFESDPCVFYRNSKEFGMQLVGVYVDDIMHLCTSRKVHEKFVKYLNSFFPTVDTGVLEWILGIRIQRDRKARQLTMDQSQAIKMFMTENDYNDLNAALTPMEENWKHDPDSPLLEEKDATKFRSQLMSIAYWAQYTRPDLSTATIILCRYVSKPTEYANLALRRLIRYLKDTIEYGIQYKFLDKQTLKLECFTDSSWGGDDSVQAKSTSGYIVYFGGGPISWSSGLQSVIAQSSGEAEYIAAFNASTNVVYHRQFLDDLGIQLTGATLVWEDNTAAIAMSKNPVNHKRCRHILVKYHYLRDLHDQEVIKLQYLKTTDQIADLMTKPTSRAILLRLRPYLVKPIITLKKRINALK
jgi:hypothetical protein